MSTLPPIVDNEAANRFELNVDGLLAELDYRQEADRLVLMHTEVPDQLGGRGVGGALVAAAVDRAAKEGLTLVPRCPFAREWLKRHENAAAAITIEW